MTKRYHYHFCATYYAESGETTQISNVAYSWQSPADFNWYSDVKLTVLDQFKLDVIDPSRVIITSLTILHVEEMQ